MLASAITLLYMYRDELKLYRWWIAAGGCALAIVYYLLKQGSANGRGIMQWVSGHSIMEHPWIGTGIGSFKHQYAQTMGKLTEGMPDGSLQSADVLDYSFNEWMHIGVEQGLVGLLFAGCTVLLLLRNARNEGSTLKWCLPVLLITSLFSYTFELLPFQIIMVVLMAHTGSAQTRHKKRSVTKSVCYATLSIILCLIPLQQLRQRAKENEEYDRIAGYMDACFIPDCYEMLPWMSDNPKFLFNFGKMLREEALERQQCHAAQGRTGEQRPHVRGRAGQQLCRHGRGGTGRGMLSACLQDDAQPHLSSIQIDAAVQENRRTREMPRHGEARGSIPGESGVARHTGY